MMMIILFYFFVHSKMTILDQSIWLNDVALYDIIIIIIIWIDTLYKFDWDFFQFSTYRLINFFKKLRKIFIIVFCFVFSDSFSDIIWLIRKRLLIDWIQLIHSSTEKNSFLFGVKNGSWSNQRISIGCFVYVFIHIISNEWFYSGNFFFLDFYSRRLFLICFVLKGTNDR